MSAAFAFVPFGGHASSEAVSCDGLVDGAGLHLSHWDKNHTPRELKADTSVEIALRFVEANASDLDARPVANNHFDTDGVLAVFTLLEPETAQAHRSLIVSAAEAGDFDEWPSDERGLWLDAAIRALGSRAGGDRSAYAAVLPQLRELCSTIEARRDLWGEEADTLRAAIERDGVRCERAGKVALFVHERGEPEAPGPMLSRLAGEGCTRWLIALQSNDGFSYRYERPRYAWADTVRRVPIAAPSKNAIARELGEGWAIKGELGMTGLCRTVRPIALAPEVVLERIFAGDPGAR
jgi:hypothetical protein